MNQYVIKETGSDVLFRIVTPVPPHKNARKFADSITVGPTDNLYICLGYSDYDGSPLEVLSKKHGNGPWSD